MFQRRKTWENRSPGKQQTLQAALRHQPMASCRPKGSAVMTAQLLC